MQKPGTIPDDDILDVLNAKPAYIGPLKAGFQLNDGTPPLMVQAELYGRGEAVEFVYMFDDQPGRPILKQASLAAGVLLKALPEAHLDRAFWAYEDRRADPALNSLIYFFKIKVSGGELTRTAAGQLPLKYLALLLGK